MPYFAVGDDGSAMLSIQTNGFYWVPPGAGVERSVRLSAGGRPLAIHQEAGETIVYFGNSVVYRVNPRTGERRSIPVPSGCEQLQVEPQSRIFAVCEKNQLVEFSAGRARVWLTDNNGVSSYVVAASADVAWYTTGHGELKKFSLTSGKSVRVVRPVTEWHFPNMTFVPGNLHEINSRTAFHGAGNARIRMNGLEAPIVSVEPERIRFQIPWDVAAGPAVFEASGFAESEFELASVEIPIQRFAPNYFVDRKPAFVHGDWRGLITESDPARPGEVIHVFLTGLGPVSPPWPLGTPAPDDATHKITAGIACDMAPYKSAPARTVEVLYAGLAPGTIGFFQVSMQIPADEGSGYLTCRLSDGAGNKGEFEHYLTLRQ